MNEPASYSGLSTLNHWITAILAILMWTLGLAAGQAPEAAEDYIMSIHIALGFFVLLFVLWRIGFRLYEGFPEPAGTSGIERGIAAWMHRLLLLVLLVMVLTGPLYLFTENEGMNVFGWFTFYIPVPLGETAHEAIEAIHKFSGQYLLPALVAVHVLAAAKHWLLDSKASPRNLRGDV